MKAASFTTEYHNSRQNMLRIYLVDNRSEVCINLFWEYINGICFKCVIAYFFIGFQWQKWLECFFRVIDADYCNLHVFLWLKLSALRPLKSLTEKLLRIKKEFHGNREKISAQWAFVWRRRIFYQIKVVLN
jgi:hypothetical protein